MSKRRQPITPVSEEILHRHVAQFLDIAVTPPWFWTTIGHGGGGRVRGSKLKAMGVKRGWPDILIVGPGPIVVGLELKREGGKQSMEQVMVEDCFRFSGCKYFLCRSVEEVYRALHLVMRGKAA